MILQIKLFIDSPQVLPEGYGSRPEDPFSDSTWKALPIVDGSPAVESGELTSYVESPGAEAVLQVSCQTLLPVPTPDPNAEPQCSLAINPPTVKVGQAVKVFMSSVNAGYATINGEPVAVPLGSKIITPTAAGDYSVTGFVSNPGGSSASCRATYHVEAATPTR